MLTFAICDDNVPFCSELEQKILEYTLNNKRLCEIEIFYSGESLIKKLNEQHSFDVLFLDIELTTTTGIEVGKYIREDLENDDVYIVYISSKSSYAMQLFQVRPIDFLLKPIQRDKLKKVMEVIYKLNDRNQKFFEYKVGHGYEKILLKEIIYFESIDKKVVIHNIHNKNISFYGKLNTIEKQLNEKGFFHIHKSFLINYEHTLVFNYDEVVMSNKVVLPISQSRRASIRKMHLQMRGVVN